MALKRSLIQNLIQEYKEEIVLARKKFRLEQPESSHASETTSFTHTIFYESFESYPTTLEGGFKIYPRRWALAFLQSDIKSIAEILCESIFTEQDLKNRNSSRDGAKVLPSLKKIAIQRAAKWLMNKNQDPWSFKPGAFPNREEKAAIEEVFETFSRIDPLNVLNVMKSESHNEEVGINIDHEDCVSSSSEDEDAFFVESVIGSKQALTPPSSPTVKMEYNDIFEDLVVDFEYCTAFQKVIDLGRKGKRTYLGNTAQTAKILTKMVIPQNEDIFVDAVQYSNDRWGSAVDGETVEEIAEPLFRKYWKADFIFRDIAFRNLDDFSPPKTLALLRAVAWIMKLRKDGCWEDSLGFDSAIPDHNIYPTTSEINRIYNYLSTKYGDGPCRPEIYEPVEMNTDMPTSTTSTTSIPHNGSYSKFTCVVPTTPMNKMIASTVFTRPRMYPVQPTLQTPDVQGNGKIRGHIIPPSCWKEAMRRFRLDEKLGAEKAGKYLFEETFTAQEIQEGNFSGRGDKEQFDPSKVDAILRALEHMRGITFGNGKVTPLAKSERKELITKIFIEHSNYLRRKLKYSDTVASRIIVKPP